MVEKSYDWEHGATLQDHTKKKHEILKNYFRQYLLTRCKIPQQERFRLAIVDGFSGAGLYSCGNYGSPLIFVDTLITTCNEINIHRINQDIKPIRIECLILLNDSSPSVTQQLKKNLSPLIVKAKETPNNLFIETEYFSKKFEILYPDLKKRLVSAKCSNVFFNLDQCGYSDVTSDIIKDIMLSWRSSEVLLTFMIKSLLAFLSPNKVNNKVPLEKGLKQKIDAILESNEAGLRKKEWLAEAEKIAFNYLKNCANFVSPFSINNPSGWQYWLMHFASSYRARQVYNDVLHQSGAQAHFGRPGLHMLSYDPSREGQLYLFDNDSRQAAKHSLYEDIPRLVAESGDTMLVQDFYSAAYSETPAHSNDIHEMIIENADIEIITEHGGSRRTPNTIRPTDTLKLKKQKSLFFMFPHTKR